MADALDFLICEYTQLRTEIREIIDRMHRTMLQTFTLAGALLLAYTGYVSSKDDVLGGNVGLVSAGFLLAYVVLLPFSFITASSASLIAAMAAYLRSCVEGPVSDKLKGQGDYAITGWEVFLRKLRTGDGGDIGAIASDLHYADFFSRVATSLPFIGLSFMSSLLAAHPNLVQGRLLAAPIWLQLTAWLLLGATIVAVFLFWKAAASLDRQ